MSHPRRPTRFEQRVYAIVRRIPRGQTRSYRWVARRLGNPGLARAVGNALNRNPYVGGQTPQGRRSAARGQTPSRRSVPCHRVIHADGTLGGFARGAARKRALLRREGVSIA